MIELNNVPLEIGKFLYFIGKIKSPILQSLLKGYKIDLNFMGSF